MVIIIIIIIFIIVIINISMYIYIYIHTYVCFDLFICLSFFPAPPRGAAAAAAPLAACGLGLLAGSVRRRPPRLRAEDVK